MVEDQFGKKIVLITGLGSIGQRHVRCLREIYDKNIEIHAYRHRNLNQIIDDELRMIEGDPSKKYGIIIHEDLDVALKYKPEAVFITNPPDLHIETAIKAANMGCNLFIEKPLSNSTKNIDQLIKIVDDNDLICRVGQQFRFHPFTLLLKNYIDNQIIGEISSAEFIYKEYLPGMHPYEDYRLSHASNKKRGGGVILSLNHYIDIVCYFFGYPNELVCFGGTNGNLDIKAEDTATIIFNYRKNNGRVNTVTILIDFIKRPKQMEWSFTADYGSIHADFCSNMLYLNNYKNERINENIPLSDFKRNDLFINEQKEYFDLIKGGENFQTLPDLTESKEILNLSFKIIKSLESGKVFSM